MTEYLTEQEQIQQLKNWVNQYGLTILIGILLALGISSGWRYWQDYQTKYLTQASLVYDQMLISHAQNNLQNMTVQAQKIIHTYPKTSYAQMAALMLAQNSIASNNISDAKVKLNWVVEHSKESILRDLARTRLARVLISEKQPQAAIEILKKINSPSLTGLVNEIRGDAYSALNDKSAAHNAYELALSENNNLGTARPILQMKFDNLSTDSTT